MSKPIILQNKWNYLKFKHAGDVHKWDSSTGLRADAVMWYNGFLRWDWRNKDTFCNRHYPGITVESVQFLMGKGCKIIILTSGYGNPDCTVPGKLEVQENVLKYLKDNNIIVYTVKTEIASKLWNTLMAANKKVGMLFHSTC